MEVNEVLWREARAQAGAASERGMKVVKSLECAMLRMTGGRVNQGSAGTSGGRRPSVPSNGTHPTANGVILQMTSDNTVR